MKKITMLIFGVLTTLIVIDAHAETLIMDTKVTGVMCGIFGGANMCQIYFDKQSNSTCAGPTFKHRMTLDTGTSIGKSLLSVALMANASGKIVVVKGTGTCSIWPDTEDLDVLFTSPSCASSFNSWGCTNQ